MEEKTAYKTIDEYIEKVQVSEEVRQRMKELRAFIHAQALQATERISWGMPTFYLNGNLVHFAAHKNHIGFYPGANGVAHFAQELSEYKTSKGAIQFPHSAPLPLPLIGKIVRFRVEENTSQ